MNAFLTVLFWDLALSYDCGMAMGLPEGGEAEGMGHSSTAMIHKHYQHVLDSQTRQVMDSMPNLVAIQTCHTAESGKDQDTAPFCMASTGNSQLKQ